MSIEGGKSGNQIAEELGVNKNSVYRWISQYKRKTGIQVLSSSKPAVNKVQDKGQHESQRQLL